MEGTIDRISYDRGFGFIRVDGDPAGDHFFHAKDLVCLAFDESLRGLRVEFDSYQAPKGLAAQNVRLVEQA